MKLLGTANRNLTKEGTWSKKQIELDRARQESNMSAQSKKSTVLNGPAGAIAAEQASSSAEMVGIHVASGKPLLALQPTLEEAGNVTATDLCRERHYSVAELAQLWNLSEKTIRRMFEKEPGVLQWGGKETRFKRAYTTLRIPETVALRMHRRLRIAG